MQVGNCENDMENHKGNITISRAKKVPVVNMLKGCFDFLFFFFKQHSFRSGGSDSTAEAKIRSIQRKRLDNDTQK